jgi:hypothetical protein
MAKAIRTRPSKTSRGTLWELARKGVLMPSNVGIRNIVRAETGEIEEQGFDLPSLNRVREGLPAGYRFDLAECHAWVGYNGGRAHLTALRKSGYRQPHSAESPSALPINVFAGRLIQQPDVRGAFYLPVDGKLYGNAVLVTDVRRHWIFSARKADAEEIELFHDMLITPKSLITGWGGELMIFFHEEPCEADLIFTKLRWG